LRACLGAFDALRRAATRCDALRRAATRRCDEAL
jgi:hypothetical protein